MSKQVIRSIFIFTILAPIYAMMNVYIFTMFSMHIQENGGLWGDYFVMYFSFTLVLLSFLLAFINFRIRNTVGKIWSKISIVNFIFLFIFEFVFIASIFYSLQN